jgi:hypothetical protein
LTVLYHGNHLGEVFPIQTQAQALTGAALGVQALVEAFQVHRIPKKANIL